MAWGEKFIAECEHTMTESFKKKISKDPVRGLYLIGQTAFNPDTNEQFCWLKVGKTTNAESRFLAYRTSNPCVFYIDWLPVRGKNILKNNEETCHIILQIISKNTHRAEWFQVPQEIYLKICDAGFTHFTNTNLWKWKVS